MFAIYRRPVLRARLQDTFDELVLLIDSQVSNGDVVGLFWNDANELKVLRDNEDVITFTEHGVENAFKSYGKLLTNPPTAR